MSVTNTIELKIKEFIGRLAEAQKYAFFSAIIFGLLAHGFVLTNRLSVHDNSHCLFDLGASYEVNRWGLGILYKLMVLSTKTFSLPLFNGFMSIVFIGIAAMLLMDIFEVKSKLVAVIIGGLMVVFPMVTSVFSFMFTSWPYFLGLIFAFQAARVLTKELSVKSLIISSLWLALTLSIYQAYLGVVVTLFLVKMLLDVIDGKTESVAAYAIAGVSSLVELGLGLGIWAVISKIFMKVKNITPNDYKGWTEPYNIAKFPKVFVNAIKNFLTFRMEGINALRYLRMLSLLIFILAVVMIVMLLIKSQAKLAVKLSSIVGAALIPVAMMVVYLLSTSDMFAVTTLMIYAEVFVFIIPLILIERFEGFENALVNKAAQCTSLLLIFCTSVVTIGYVYLDNAAYNKAAIFQEQAVVYMTALLANIKATDGFSDDMEIVFVGFNNIADETINEVARKEELDGIQLEKYYNSLEEMLNYGVNIQFARDHLGIGNEKMVMEDMEEITSLPQVQAMPTYPNEGSIAIIDNKVIVKMGEAN
ncbi:Glucosyl transferase GtrII [Pseudobutyrivibrio sp. UC1225]|uniref:glucosyltransferase domain-containing protein n=1 Tax=Pseudobutyrivibrio sp. UC1225 TaxID=1798185 RepID=UPI0008F30072|nr:glucosyltransferase domain-containing protein [Pseudobutyrivibrio sp. UC1225]SFN78155.1 Glucosyl transferase GtrII [Pseudobutyrivibrio sp. UC1225]